ncbi:MAG: extracellular solute-binding protein [Lachnospiraceae bacterium]|nr:extracellular solute-binding protein [Lachnospiraceae bacterium]
MKKNGVISMLLVMALLLSACGGNKSNETTGSKRNKNAVFREMKDAYEIKDDVSQIVTVGDVLYVEQYRYENELPQAKLETQTAVNVSSEVKQEEKTAEVEKEETTEDVLIEEEINSELLTIRTITGYASDGTVVSQVEKQLSLDNSGGYFTADEEGNIYSIMYKYPSYEEEDDKEKVYLECYGPDGNELWKIQLNENITEDEYFYVSSLQCDDKKQLIVDTSRGIEVYDQQGNPVKMIEKLNVDESKLLRIRDDKIAVLSFEGSGVSIQTLDIQRGNYGTKTLLPANYNYYSYQIISGLHYDLYLGDEYGIYGYNIGDTELTKVMDYISSDFASNYIYQFSFLDKNTFVALYYDNEGVQLSKFEKVPAEEVVDKTELTLGCYYLDQEVKQKLVEFNKSSDQYKIYVRDYATYDTMDDYTQGMTRLNTDIISGEVPDIMLLNSQMPVESYIAKGVFANLNEFLENDSQLKKDDLLENVLDALSTGDELYRIAPSFSVTSFAAKTADVGEEPGWTMDEALALLATKPEGTQLLSEMTSSNFMYYTMWICGQKYVDWDKGECYFDTDGFKKILEYANSLPREIDYSAVIDDETYWAEMEAQYRNGKTILNLQYLSGFRDYAYAKQGTFGEDITYIGFPVEEGMGGCLNINKTMAISALSKNQDAAWEFVKSFLAEEYQDNLGYDFPVRISSMKKLEEKSWEKPYTIDEEGNKYEYEDSFFVGGVEVPVQPLTKEESAKLLDYITSLDSLCTYNEALNNIIIEETESYFSGQKSVDEVVKIIQSRAKIYVSENS